MIGGLGCGHGGWVEAGSGCSKQTVILRSLMKEREGKEGQDKVRDDNREGEKRWRTREERERKRDEMEKGGRNTNGGGLE